MSCPKKNSSLLHKPKKTLDMKIKNMDYIWKEVMGNPNLYCWIPENKKNILPINLHISDVSIQDIPPIPGEDWEKKVEIFAEEADKNKKFEALNKLEREKNDKTLVSTDDPRKYLIVKNFIIKKGLKLYGGTAINAYLPKDRKIYKDTDIPDYDFYSYDPWNHAVELTDEFYKAGYEFCEARAGIHKGTYKVFVNMWPVADISYLPKKEFDKIKTTVIEDIPISDTFQLIHEIYKEIAQPYGNAARWPKVSIREKLFQNSVNPLGKKFNCSKDLFSGGNIKVPDFKIPLMKIAYEFIIKKDLIFTGPIAYNTYMEIGGSKNRILIDKYRVLSENARSDVDELFTKLIKIYKNLEITTLYSPVREVNNTSYTILALYNGVVSPICEINSLTSCTPHQHILNRTIVSIDYLKYDLYYTTVFAETEKESVDAKCKIQYLNKIQEYYYKTLKIKETDPSPFQRFIIKCRGPFEDTVKVAVLERWKNKIERDSKIVRYYDRDYRIRKIPKDEIPKECLDKTKTECIYPCAWNKYSNKCTGLPNSSYRPNDIHTDMVTQYKE
jgi:Poly(A) polymerase catalytic subunit